MKFVFDLDGTICFKGQPLSKGITAALEGCMADGHEVIFASARPIRDLLPVLPNEMRKFPMVGGNGAFVAQAGEIIEVITFKEEIVAVIRDLMTNYQLPYLVDSDWNYAYTGSEEHPIYQNLDPLKLAQKVSIEDLQDIVKIVLFPNGYDKEIFEKLQQLPIALYEHSAENILDMSPGGIDKWSGLSRLGVVEGEYIAFGNDANDLAMFTKARESICVGEHPVREHATMQVANNEQAVVAMIQRLSEKYK